MYGKYLWNSFPRVLARADRIPAVSIRIPAIRDRMNAVACVSCELEPILVQSHLRRGIDFVKSYKGSNLTKDLCGVLNPGFLAYESVPCALNLA